MRRAALLILLGCAAITVVGAQLLTTIQAEFVRTKRVGTMSETVRGTLFYQYPDLVILVVCEPVSQWIVFEKGSMMAWYPETGRAFRFSEMHPSIHSFASAFVGVPRADFGLAQAGFTLAGSEIRDGTLVDTMEAASCPWKVSRARDRDQPRRISPHAGSHREGRKVPGARVLHVFRFVWVAFDPLPGSSWCR